MNNNTANSNTNGQNSTNNTQQIYPSNSIRLSTNASQANDVLTSQPYSNIQSNAIQQPQNINFSNNINQPPTNITQQAFQNTNIVQKTTSNTQNAQIPSVSINSNANTATINKTIKQTQSIIPNTSNQSINIPQNTVTQSPYVQNNTIIPSENNMVNQTATQRQESNDNTQTDTSLKKVVRKILIVLMIIGIIITAAAIYLLIDNNNRYKNYIASPADLIDFDTISKNGLTYYKGNYKYKVDKKEYYYTPDTISRQRPEQLIQIKYDENNPEKLYNENLSKYFLIMLFSGIGLSFISGISAMALSSSKSKEIITAQVIEQVNCVGGRRIYFSNINITENSKEADAEKYYVYFSNDNKKFALGNKVNFNIYKYGEVFTTEKYKNINARRIYNFKDDDFTLISNNVN